MKRFETHSHSHYSSIRLIDSINKPRDMILTAYKLGYAGITLTDHEALCGHIEWLELEKELKEKGEIPKDFKCGLGNEIYLIDERGPKQKYYHFILIAKNTLGHRALRELSSAAWLNGYSDRGMERVPTTRKELAAIIKKYPGTLIGTNACIGGKVGSLVLALIEAEKNNNLDEIYKIKKEIDDFLHWCKELFGDDFYFEIAPGTSPDQKRFNQRAKAIAQFYGLKMICATDAHYLTADLREVHKAFLNSKDGEREVDSFYHDAHLMSNEEAFEKISPFYTQEEFDEMCKNSLEIMEKIETYELFHNPIIPEVKLPPCVKFYDESLSSYPILQSLRNSDNIQERTWAKNCLLSLKERNLEKDEYFERLELEAKIIKDISEKLGNCLFTYFNTFNHYIDLFWECGAVVGPGRGSAGSFLSNYLLNITQLDPIQWKLPYFRFLNEDRAELPDIDIDLPPSKRPLILKEIRKERGELNVVQVATFGTESAKAAIACACRGYRSKDYPKGIDIDISQYMSSLVPFERGISWTIDECLNGNEEKGRKPVKELIKQIAQYPGLEEIIRGVEGVVCRRGQHASGVMLYNVSPFETTALMRSPNGDITTQYDLKRSESVGDTKFDFLVTDICDKISTCLDLLMKDGFFAGLKKREIYNQYLHPQVLNLNDPKIWDALAAGSVQDVFQFNTPIGIQTAKAIMPVNPTEMTAANALMRLTAQEGQERPFDRYVRFKKDISLWYQEMDAAGLTKEEQKTLEPYYLKDYGVPASQEALMLLTMDPKISHFTLGEANHCRKILAKKKIKEIPALKEKFLSQCPSKALGQYTWTTMMLPQLSYSFSMVHATLYSFIGIQTLVLATSYPSVYWNCACLIVNAQSLEDVESSEEELDDTPLTYSNEMEEFSESDNEADIVDSYEEDCDGAPVEVVVMKNGKKKKKVKTTNFGRIATAIGKMAASGISVSPPDINDSDFTFSPDVEHNLIRYGLRGIAKIGEDLVKTIMANRPYTSLEDFQSKVKTSKPQLINLLKSGAFDAFGDRVEMMKNFIDGAADKKQTINLRNLQMLISENLIPEKFEEQVRYFNFNKYLKKLKWEKYYALDNIAFKAFERYAPMDILIESGKSESGFLVLQTDWDKIWKKQQDILRPWVKEHSEELRDEVNQRSFNDLWKKYADGTVSKWEMDSVSYYSHPHELAKVNQAIYGFADYFKLPESPTIENVLKIKGKDVPIFKIERICGTILDKDKNKKTLSLLTTTGVVTVRIFGDVFTHYDRQISRKNPDGTKTVLQKSWFARGNKIIICGIRREDSFQLKKYSRTPWHLVELITKVNDDGTIETCGERLEV